MGKSFMFSPQAEIRSYKFWFEYICIRKKLVKKNLCAKIAWSYVAEFLLQIIDPTLYQDE